MTGKYRSTNTVNDIAKFVSLGYSQSPSNCRVLLDAIKEANTARALAENRYAELADKIKEMSK